MAPKEQWQTVTSRSEVNKKRLEERKKAAAKEGAKVDRLGVAEKGGAAGALAAFDRAQREAQVRVLFVFSLCMCVVGDCLRCLALCVCVCVSRRLGP